MLHHISALLVVVGVVAAGSLDREAKQVYFAKEHSKLMSQLDTGLLGDLAKVTGSAAQEPVYSTATPRVKWSPIQCGLLDYDFQRIETIHKGKRNTVYKLVDEKSGRLFAHKIFKGPDEYTAELTVSMLTADHPYMVMPICILPSHGKPGIVFEYVSGVPSSSYVLHPKVGYKDVQRMSAQLFDAITYIHFQGYIHADLKPDNVMMTPEGDIKVIDFGFALRIPYTKGNRGTASTMAPELVKAVPGPVAEGTDWWAYGSTVAMWNSLIIARSKKGRYVPLILDKSAESLNSMFKFGSCSVQFSTELQQFLAMFLQPDVKKRRFNKKAEINFVKNTVYLRDQFTQ